MEGGSGTGAGGVGEAAGGGTADTQPERGRAGAARTARRRARAAATGSPQRGFVRQGRRRGTTAFSRRKARSERARSAAPSATRRSRPPAAEARAANTGTRARTALEPPRASGARALTELIFRESVRDTRPVYDVESNFGRLQQNPSLTTSHGRARSASLSSSLERDGYGGGLLCARSPGVRRVGRLDGGVRRA